MGALFSLCTVGQVSVVINYCCAQYLTYLNIIMHYFFTFLSWHVVAVKQHAPCLRVARHAAILRQQK